MRWTRRYQWQSDCKLFYYSVSWRSFFGQNNKKQFCSHKSYKIYYTNQVLDPIDKWNSIIVPVDDMPYPLVMANPRNTNDLRSYFMRISAINAEVGEGPHSHIIELKKTLKSECFCRFLGKSWNFQLCWICWNCYNKKYQIWREKCKRVTRLRVFFPRRGKSIFLKGYFFPYR